MVIVRDWMLRLMLTAVEEDELACLGLSKVSPSMTRMEAVEKLRRCNPFGNRSRLRLPAPGDTETGAELSLTFNLASLSAAAADARLLARKALIE